MASICPTPLAFHKKPEKDMKHRMNNPFWGWVVLLFVLLGTHLVIKLEKVSDRMFTHLPMHFYFIPKQFFVRVGKFCR